MIYPKKKNKFFKALSIILSFGIASFILPDTSAGGEISKLKIPPLSPEEQQASNIIRGWWNSPPYAQDGGIAYFWAWNKIWCEKDFDAFAEKYKDVKNNAKSAILLPDSMIDENWVTTSILGNVNTLETFENPDISKYLLRIDKKNNLIYTVRKSGNMYLFKFYLAAINDEKPMLAECCTAISTDMRNISKVILPIDKELLYHNHA